MSAALSGSQDECDFERKPKRRLSFYEIQISNNRFGAGGQVSQLAGDDGLFRDAGFGRTGLQFANFFMAFSPAAKFATSFTATHDAGSSSKGKGENSRSKLCTDNAASNGRDQNLPSVQGNNFYQVVRRASTSRFFCTATRKTERSVVAAFCRCGSLRKTAGRSTHSTLARGELHSESERDFVTRTSASAEHLLSASSSRCISTELPPETMLLINLWEYEASAQLAPRTEGRRFVARYLCFAIWSPPSSFIPSPSSFRIAPCRLCHQSIPHQRNHEHLDPRQRFALYGEIRSLAAD